jgi:hypothetical protein
LVLIGRAIEHAAVARQAVVEAGWRGLGPDRGTLDLAAAERVAPPPVEPCPARIAIELSSPLRLVEAGRLVGPDALRPRHLLMSLLRRVSLLAERHGPAPLDRWGSARCGSPPHERRKLVAGTGRRAARYVDADAAAVRQSGKLSAPRAAGAVRAVAAGRM